MLFLSLSSKMQRSNHIMQHIALFFKTFMRYNLACLTSLIFSGYDIIRFWAARLGI